MNDYSDLRIFLCTTPTSMQASFDRLMGLAQQLFDQNPKRLERGTFQLPRFDNLNEGQPQQGMELDDGQLVHLLEGLDFQTGRPGKRYRRPG